MASLISRKPWLVLCLGDLPPHLFTGERVPGKYPFPPSCYEKAVSYPSDQKCSLPSAEFPGRFVDRAAEKRLRKLLRTLQKMNIVELFVFVFGLLWSFFPEAAVTPVWVFTQ